MATAISSGSLDKFLEGYELLEAACKLPKSSYDLTDDDKRLIHDTYAAFRDIYDNHRDVVRSSIFNNLGVAGMLELLTYHKTHSKRIHELVVELQKHMAHSDKKDYLTDLSSSERGFRCRHRR